MPEHRAHVRMMGRRFTQALVFGTNAESSSTATGSITSRQTLACAHDAAYDQLSQKLTAIKTKLADTQSALAATQERMGQLENMVLTLRQQVQQPSTGSAPSMPSHVPPVVPGAADFSVDEISQWFDDNARDAFLDALNQANEAPLPQAQ
ncbi:hypothetical protein LINPERPRIM_LOCUS236 [Linum perenne]